MAPSHLRYRYGTPPSGAGYRNVRVKVPVRICRLARSDSDRARFPPPPRHGKIYGTRHRTVSVLSYPNFHLLPLLSAFWRLSVALLSASAAVSRGLLLRTISWRRRRHMWLPEIRRSGRRASANR